MIRFSLRTLHRLSLMLLTVVVLQFAGANLGAHQLHSGNAGEEERNHSHLTFLAEVTTLAECIECTCPPELVASDAHQHDKVEKTELKQLDLCLDCHCHGGHPSLIAAINLPDYLPFNSINGGKYADYLSVVGNPAYRPPIA